MCDRVGIFGWCIKSTPAFEADRRLDACQQAHFCTVLVYRPNDRVRRVKYSRESFKTHLQCALSSQSYIHICRMAGGPFEYIIFATMQNPQPKPILHQTILQQHFYSKHTHGNATLIYHQF